MSGNLPAQQRALYEGITGQSAGEAAGLVTRSAALSAGERLAIYRRSYRARLLECFDSMFPALRHALGDSVFHGFALDYLRAHPPATYTLARIADDFPAHLERTRPAGEEWPGFIIGLASLELAILQIADGIGAEGQPAPDVAGIASLTDEQLLAARPMPVPCLRLFEFHYPVHRYRLAVRRGERPEIPPPERGFVAIARHNYRVVVHALDSRQYALAGMLDGRRSLGEAGSELQPRPAVAEIREALRGPLASFLRFPA